MWVALLELGFLVRWHLGYAYLSQCSPFIVCCEGAVLPVFRSFSEGIFPYIAIDSVYLWEGVSSGISSASILGHLFSPHLHFVLIVAILMGVTWSVNVVSTCISLQISDGEHLLMCLLAVSCYLWRNFYPNLLLIL